jgi:hypothetical protein
MNYTIIPSSRLEHTSREVKEMFAGQSCTGQSQVSHTIYSSIPCQCFSCSVIVPAEIIPSKVGKVFAISGTLRVLLLRGVLYHHLFATPSNNWLVAQRKCCV